MMSRVTAFYCLLLAAAPALADQSAAQTELLSAQIAYQEALKAQTDYTAKVGTLRQRLQTVQATIQQKQAEAARLQSELNEADVAAQQAGSTLEAAGRRLDAAWTAVHGR
ncbi:hypothetical protein [Neisseria shayeganii]|uniref:Peptidase M23 n=1 Tax=Neisseria shayeganii TaxID=607712 RepID=A0A7D7NFR7_9NEIS|nr:hypothetical protein [Neisseria shayeganii]QMT40474.1 hypothetical protein H3L94_11735 [Neisseria shayeganii]